MTNLTDCIIFTHTIFIRKLVCRNIAILENIWTNLLMEFTVMIEVLRIIKLNRQP
jgi:hypothetical protein